MIEGYCAGCEFSIGQITTDKQILNPDPKIPTHNTLTSRIDQAFRNPIDEFIKTHDNLLEFFDFDEKFDIKESMYIDGLIEKMMERLHRTKYLERQVKRGNLSPELLVERRKGIIAGISLSISVVLDSLRLPR